MELKDLVGKTIKSIEVDKDRSELIIKIEGMDGSIEVTPQPNDISYLDVLYVNPTVTNDLSSHSLYIGNELYEYAKNMIDNDYVGNDMPEDLSTILYYLKNEDYQAALDHLAKFQDNVFELRRKIKAYMGGQGNG